MGIKPLPKPTIAAIGASQVLTDPAALVKELVDNGLDARATSISVEIHANTLDLIQVRDNGQGIPGGDDRKLVARRYCTSKLIDKDHLSKVGGSTLGFRGEALASAAEMSGSLTISTRTESEAVAVALKISQQGEVVGTERSSLPTGTTVKVTDFLNTNPVRRQISAKNADKCVRTIKQLLQAYAFARPYVRFSLKIVRAKNDKGDWTYAPSVGSNVEEVAFKVVGSACASQCTRLTMEYAGFTCEALLPRQDANTSSISNVGPFVSIDCRPVSARRGTLKQIVKMFRDMLSKTRLCSDRISDPFLYLAISCPPASYDVNIEPSKDDVIFVDADVVLEATRKLFTLAFEPQQAQPRERLSVAIEPVHRNPSVVCSIDKMASTLPRSGNQGSSHRNPALPGKVEVWRESLPRPSSMLANEPVMTTHVTVEQPPKRRCLFRSNSDSFDIFNEVFDARISRCMAVDECEEERHVAHVGASSFDPWSLAKSNAPEECLKNKPEVLPRVSQPQKSAAQQHTGLPTPQPSSPSQLNKLFQPTEDLRRPGIERISVPQPAPPLLQLPQDASVKGLLMPAPCKAQQSPSQHLQQPGPASPAGTPLAAIPEAPARSRKHQVQESRGPQRTKPFVQPKPSGRHEPASFHRLEQGQPARARGRFSKCRRDDNIVLQKDAKQLSRACNADAGDIQCGDIRKYLRERGQEPSTAERLRGENPHSRNGEATPLQEAGSSQCIASKTNGILSSSGGLSASELAALRAHFGSENEAGEAIKRCRSEEGLPAQQVSAKSTEADVDGDQRAFMSSRRAFRRVSRNLSRSQSSKLPLEEIPKGAEVHAIVCRINVDMPGLAKTASQIDERSTFLSWGDSADGEASTFDTVFEATEIRAMVNKIKKMFDNDSSGAVEVQGLIDLIPAAIRRHAQGMASQS